MNTPQLDAVFLNHPGFDASLRDPGLARDIALRPEGFATLTTQTLMVDGKANEWLASDNVTPAPPPIVPTPTAAILGFALLVAGLNRRPRT